MLTLYYKPTCYFCQDVLGEAEQLNVKLQLKDVASNPEYKDEIIARGGKYQVPFLVDTSNDVALFESSDINAYLRDQQKSTHVLRLSGSE